MKIILTLYIIISILSNGELFAEEIELSPRSGKSLTLETRNYFGLFPEINDFRSATLHSEGGEYFFLIETETKELKYPVSDSALAGLRELIDNFEEFLAGKWKYRRNAKELTGIVKIQTRLNEVKNPMTIILMNNKLVRGYVIHFDENSIFIIPTNSFNRSVYNFVAISYNDIKTMPDMPLPIIEGEKIIFKENLETIRKSSLFENKYYYNIGPPEVINYKIKFKNIHKEDCSEPQINIDSIYSKKTSIWFEGAYERYNLNNLLLLSEYDGFKYYNGISNRVTINDYYSYGLSIMHEIYPKVRLKFGFLRENIKMYFSAEINNLQLQSNAFLIGVYYNVWKSKEIHFFDDQFYLDIFANSKMHQYKFASDGAGYVSGNLLNLNDCDITRNYNFSYAGGVSLNYKYGKIFSSLSGYLNYHDDYGILSIHRVGHTRYINYFLSIGSSIAIGVTI